MDNCSPPNKEEGIREGLETTPRLIRQFARPRASEIVAIALLMVLIWICSETPCAAVVSSLTLLTNRRLAISKAHGF